MRMEDVDARKAYIQKVRNSFDSPAVQKEKQMRASPFLKSGF